MGAQVEEELLKDSPIPFLLGSKLTLFSYGRDGHQSYSRVLYTNYKDSLIKGGMTIPNIRSWWTLAHVGGAFNTKKMAMHTFGVSNFHIQSFRLQSRCSKKKWNVYLHLS